MLNIAVQLQDSDFQFKSSFCAAYLGVLGILTNLASMNKTLNKKIM